LYAKKIVAVRHTVEMIAARTVIDRSRRRKNELVDPAESVFSTSYLSMLRNLLTPRNRVEDVKGRKDGGGCADSEFEGPTSNFGTAIFNLH
jgi:hypothetical protein